jgi:hypothetical protein
MNKLTWKKIKLIVIIISLLSMPVTDGWAASANMRSLAAVDHPLPDGTTLSFIFTDFTGVSINDGGKTAFIGILKGKFKEAVLIQNGLVAAVGDTLPDGTTLGVIAPSGQGVAINEAGKVAFFGRRESDFARGIFTQDGLVAAAGEILPDGTTLSFIPSESVSINDRGEVAFLGTIADAQNRAAVFTQNGLVVAAGATLPDGTQLDTIFTDFSSLSINNAGRVAFFGRRAEDLARGVFTQDGLVAAEGHTLPDGTVVGKIFTLRTGVSINDRGKVAFFGLLDGALGQPAVFTQDGLITAVGETLRDGTTLSRVFYESVSINNEGKVAFTGVIGGPLGRPAVFTQDGLVATTGDPLPDGLVLTNIYRDCISLNNIGQIAFIGQADSVAAVLRVENGKR